MRETATLTPTDGVAKKRADIRSLRVSDICLIFYAISSIAFDDGSLISQISRVAIVAGAFTELGKTRFKLTGYHAWLIVFACVVFASRYWAFSATRAISIFSTVLYNLICLSCVAFLIYRDKRRVRIVMACMVFAPLVLEARVIASDGLLAFFSSRATESISANTVGMFSAFGMFLAYGFYREHKCFGWAFLVVVNLCISLLSASRKAVMVIAIVVLFIVVLDSDSRDAFGKAAKFALAVFALLLVGALIMNIPFLYNLIGVRLEGMVNGMLGMGSSVDASTKTRMNLVSYGLEWFSEKPILGYGGDNFRALMTAFHPGQTAYYAHNNYVELLVSYGIVGTVIYYFLYVRMAIKGLLNRKRLSFFGITMLCLLIGLVIMDYGMVEYYSRDAQLFIALAWAILVGNTTGNTEKGSSK